MKDINKVQVRYLYRHEWKVKYVTLSQIAEWTRSGKYQGRVDAARGLRETPMEGGMVCGPMAADELPMVMPTRMGLAFSRIVVSSASHFPSICQSPLPAARKKLSPLR